MFWALGRVVSWAEIVRLSKRQTQPDFPLRLFNLTTPADAFWAIIVAFIIATLLIPLLRNVAAVTAVAPH
jgi:hypothetical protein